MTSRPPGSQDVEWLDLGPPDHDDAVPPWHPSRRLVLTGIVMALAVIVAVAAVVAANDHHTHGQASAQHRRTPSATPDTATNPAEFTATAAPRSGPPVVTTIGHPLLGVTGGWELFVRGDNVVVRVQMAAGIVTVTPVPTLDTGGGIAFLVTATAAFALPSDFVPGYSVANRSAATLLPGGLAGGGNVYSGPADGQFWQQITSQDTTSAFQLVDAAGHNLHRTITLPPTMFGSAISDGSGYLIVQGVGGSYDARTGSLRRITTGQVTAVGPTEWLAEECDDVGQCSNVVVNKATWQRQVVGPTQAPSAIASGVISPDGSLAAVTQPAKNHRLSVDLIEIATGAEHTVAEISEDAIGDQTLAWSPDGRWLFVIGNNGTIQVVDSTTLQHTGLGVQLPPAVQLTIRPATPR